MTQENFLRTLARYSSDIRTGNLAFNYRTGECGPVQATRLNSWGPGCPPGYCPPDHMPEALGRYFAGDRTGCRELPYCVELTSATPVGAAITVSREITSKVTMCPTRIIAWSNLNPELLPFRWVITEIKFGNQNQLVGGPVPVLALDPGAFQDVPIVPDCLRAGMPFTVSAELSASGNGPLTSSLWFVFIGPCVG